MNMNAEETRRRLKELNRYRETEDGKLIDNYIVAHKRQSRQWVALYFQNDGKCFCIDFGHPEGQAIDENLAFTIACKLMKTHDLLALRAVEPGTKALLRW